MSELHPIEAAWRYLPGIAAGFIVLVTLIYAVARWRKAPTAFKAIIWVAAANLVAGLLIGVWSLRAVDRWTGTDASRPVKVPGADSTAASAAALPASTAPAGAPTISGTAPLPPSERTAPILNAYIGQALAQRWPIGKELAGGEVWPQVDQGCRLGSHQPASTLCKAAALELHGWGDTRAASLEEVASFCDAGYLEKKLHLCRTAYGSSDRGASSTMPEPSSVGAAPGTGIPESDVTQELAKYHTTWGPSGNVESFEEVIRNCTSGVYAPTSPVCEAADLMERRGGGSGRVGYVEVASFCDVRLVRESSEVCRAAYHFADASGDGMP
jgi:hypothetical protein